MRRVLLPGAVALVLAVGLVLLVAGGEEDVVVDDEPTTTTETQGWTVTDDVNLEDDKPESTPEPEPEGGTSIEEAVALYVEAAERGGVNAPGLPTSDELSIEDVRSRGDRATVRLAGGSTLMLGRQDGSWQVIGFSAPDLTPTPPSDGP